MFEDSTLFRGHPIDVDAVRRALMHLLCIFLSRTAIEEIAPRPYVPWDEDEDGNISLGPVIESPASVASIRR
jgi:hypothetical protein